MMMEEEKEASFKSYQNEIPIKTIAHLEYLKCQYSRDLFKKKLYQIFDIADFNNDRDNQLCHSIPIISIQFSNNKKTKRPKQLIRCEEMFKYSTSNPYVARSDATKINFKG